MMRKQFSTFRRQLMKLYRLVSQANVLALFPLATISAYWFGDQAILFAVSIILPLILALQAFIRPDIPAKPALNSDPLTQLPRRDVLLNRFDDVLKSRHKTGLNTACIVVDIDDFTAINASQGQLHGNEILKRVAERLLVSVREQDIITRLENDSFAIGLDPVYDVDLESTLSIVRRLQKAIQEPMNIGGRSVSVTVSSGYCLGSGSPENTGPALIEAAGVAMNEARLNGANGIRGFTSELRLRNKSSTILNDEVSEALRCGQITAWFQPQISTITGQVVGFETLARWVHPRRGILQPEDFLPAVDSAGLFPKLGELMLNKALTALQVWQEAGQYVERVAINLSYQELSQPKLVEKLTWELDRFGMAHDRLCIEIQETVLAPQKKALFLRQLQDLATLGCAIDLNNFGTGHSSITSLRNFPVQRIKIDKSFVTGMHKEKGQQNMMRAIMTLADQLNLKSLAEGVEDIEDLKLLSEMGCEFVQGYCISRPMPQDDALDWLNRYNEKLHSSKSAQKLAS